MAGSRWSRIVFLVVALVLANPTVAVGRSAFDGSRPGPTGTSGATATVKPFTLDLSVNADFVAQTDFVQCVGASMQMMLNMIRPGNDRTAATQRNLQVLARSLSGVRPDGRERQGASVRGWTAGLNVLDAGPFRTVGTTDLDGILKIAARAIRETGLPVGLLVWRGRHAWVMAGFTATADPAVTDDFRVTKVIVMDPLYPHGSKVWGPSPGPRQALSVGQLGRQFVPRGSGSSTAAAAWAQGFSGKYVIVMPFVAIPAVRTMHVPR